MFRDARRICINFQIDLRVMARVFFARVLWLQGFPDRAIRAARKGVSTTLAGSSAISLCYLFLKCARSPFLSRLVAAEQYGSMLL